MLRADAGEGREVRAGVPEGEGHPQLRQQELAPSQARPELGDRACYRRRRATEIAPRACCNRGGRPSTESRCSGRPWVHRPGLETVDDLDYDPTTPSSAPIDRPG